MKIQFKLPEDSILSLLNILQDSRTGWTEYQLPFYESPTIGNQGEGIF